MRREGSWLGPAVRFLGRSLHGLGLRLSWRLDDLLYPEWREASMEGPIFVVGHWRSGTTFLHRALVEDVLTDGVATNFAETYAPTVTLRRLFEGIAALGGERMRSYLEELDDRHFGELDAVHRTRFREIAEDSHLLSAMYATVMWVKAGPPSLEDPELRPIVEPDGRSEEEQIRTLRAYRGCLRKNAYLSEPDAPVVVAKNPEFSRRIPLLREVFPEAKFVALARNPLETLPSLLEMIESIWQFSWPGRSATDPPGSFLERRHAERLLEMSVDVHRGVTRDLADVPQDDKYVARFDDFVGAPGDHLERLTDRFGLGRRRSNFRQRVETRSRRVRNERDRDRATLEDFDLHADEVAERLDGYMDRWSFERHIAGSTCEPS